MYKKQCFPEREDTAFFGFFAEQFVFMFGFDVYLESKHQNAVYENGYQHSCFVFKLNNPLINTKGQRAITRASVKRNFMENNNFLT